MPDKILIIDDSPDIHALIKVRLGKEDVTLIDTYDGSSGIAAAHIQKPDLILLDVEMPDMDGFAVCDIGLYERIHGGRRVLLAARDGVRTRSGGLREREILRRVGRLVREERIAELPVRVIAGRLGDALGGLGGMHRVRVQRYDREIAEDPRDLARGAVLSDNLVHSVVELLAVLAVEVGVFDDLDRCCRIAVDVVGTRDRRDQRGVARARSSRRLVRMERKVDGERDDGAAKQDRERDDDGRFIHKGSAWVIEGEAVSLFQPLVSILISLVWFKSLYLSAWCASA